MDDNGCWRVVRMDRGRSKEVAPLSVGITLVIIGIGLSLRTISYRIGVQADVADRIAYTFMGLVTLMYGFYLPVC
ncbi:MAG: hypothetical protein Ct9H300mP11_14820 [Chloroflexota bacterium]|nr:MAG: hypothetical protein Ct9H300mP11_14820 [Chloroflexota bacterium]